MFSSKHRLLDQPGGPNLSKNLDSRQGRRLGIDVGSVRIGVAFSDPDGILATQWRRCAVTVPLSTCAD